MNIPIELNEWVLANDIIYRQDLYPDDRGLKSAQEDKAFYIPSFKEIIDFGTNGYPLDSKEAKRLEQFLIKKMGAKMEEAEFACSIIQMQISGDCRMQDIFDIFEDFGFALENESHINQLMQCINELWNNTRMLLNRGFTPNETATGKKGNNQSLSGKEKVINFAQAKKRKIGSVHCSVFVPYMVKMRMGVNF